MEKQQQEGGNRDLQGKDHRKESRESSDYGKTEERKNRKNYSEGSEDYGKNHEAETGQKITDSEKRKEIPADCDGHPDHFSGESEI